MTIELIQGDCIEEMIKMQEESIALAVTSPPYDNLRTYESCLQWHEGIWKKVLKGLYRVTKKGGVVVWIVGDATIKGSETGTSFKQALYAKEIGFNLHDTMIWQKPNYAPMYPSVKRYDLNYEFMFVFSNNSVFSKRNAVWICPNGQKRGIGHPAPFPLQLATDHIRSWSNEGDTVLDSFMGSGTTGIACKDLNRNFIGIEKVNKYFEIAKERIDNDH